jgi:hypothetical protein
MKRANKIAAVAAKEELSANVFKTSMSTIIPHDAMSGANEMAVMAAKKELSVIGSADSNMASTIEERLENKMQNAAKVLIRKYQL